MKKTVLAALVLWHVLSLQAFADNADHPGVATLIDELGIRESSIASRNMPGWSRPSKITVVFFRDLPASGPGSPDWVREAVDGVDVRFMSARSTLDFDRLAESDVYVGWCNAKAISAIRKLRYMHVFTAGMDRCTTIPGILESPPIATNSAKAASETIAEHSIAMMLMLTRKLYAYHPAQVKAAWLRDEPRARPAVAVQGKSMLVLGLGGIGSQVARRAHDLGMHVIGTRNSSHSGPDYVDYVGLSDEMNTLAAQVDVVVNALPLTPATRCIVNASFFDSMRDGAYYISVGRGGTTDTDALLAALESAKLGGAGLDVTDPEPLPDDHALWTLPNVIITPHMAANSDRSIENTWIIARENLRRYIQGEKLLNLVDLARGY